MLMVSQVQHPLPFPGLRRFPKFLLPNNYAINLQIVKETAQLATHIKEAILKWTLIMRF